MSGAGDQNTQKIVYLLDNGRKNYGSRKCSFDVQVGHDELVAYDMTNIKTTSWAAVALASLRMYLDRTISFVMYHSGISYMHLVCSHQKLSA